MATGMAVQNNASEPESFLVASPLARRLKEISASETPKTTPSQTGDINTMTAPRPKEESMGELCAVYRPSTSRAGQLSGMTVVNKPDVHLSA
jgi:hypothetical protein